MKALMKAKPEEGIWLADTKRPEIGPNDVLIKVKRSAICGTDIHIYNWDEWAQSTIPVPMTVGHEGERNPGMRQRRHEVADPPAVVDLGETDAGRPERFETIENLVGVFAVQPGGHGQRPLRVPRFVTQLAQRRQPFVVRGADARGVDQDS